MEGLGGLPDPSPVDPRPIWGVPGPGGLVKTLCAILVGKLNFYEPRTPPDRSGLKFGADFTIDRRILITESRFPGPLLSGGDMWLDVELQE